MILHILLGLKKGQSHRKVGQIHMTVKNYEGNLHTASGIGQRIIGRRLGRNSHNAIEKGNFPKAVNQANPAANGGRFKGA